MLSLGPFDEVRAYSRSCCISKVGVARFSKALRSKTGSCALAFHGTPGQVGRQEGRHFCLYMPRLKVGAGKTEVVP